jgi:hypothetical protein
VFICVGLVAIANYEGIIMYMTYVGEVAWENASNMSFPVASSSFDDDSLESNLDASLHVSEVKQTADPYDWGLGMVMYVVFLSWIFMGTIILEASTVRVGYIYYRLETGLNAFLSNIISNIISHIVLLHLSACILTVLGSGHESHVQGDPAQTQWHIYQ